MSLFNETKTSLQDERDKTFALESSTVNPRSTDFCHSKICGERPKDDNVQQCYSGTKILQKQNTQKQKQSRNKVYWQGLRGTELVAFRRDQNREISQKSNAGTSGKKLKRSFYLLQDPASVTHSLLPSKALDWLWTHPIYHNIFRVSALPYGGAAKLTHHADLSQPWTRPGSRLCCLVILGVKADCCFPVHISLPIPVCIWCFLTRLRISHCPGR